MSEYHINLFWSDEDKCWIADIPDLKFCSAHGETPDEALREVQKFRLRKRRGSPAPRPTSNASRSPHTGRRFTRERPLQVRDLNRAASKKANSYQQLNSFIVGERRIHVKDSLSGFFAKADETDRRSVDGFGDSSNGKAHFAFAGSPLPSVSSHAILTFPCLQPED